MLLLLLGFTACIAADSRDAADTPLIATRVSPPLLVSGNNFNAPAAQRHLLI